MHYDFFFSCPDRATLAAALAEHGIHITSANGSPVDQADGWALDYIGTLVATPAVLDFSGGFPPVEVEPAVLFDGERAALRLFGPTMAPVALALHGATWPEGVELIAPDDVPTAQMRWAGGSVAYTPPPPPAPPSPPAEPTIEQRRAQLRARLAERRWQAETGGIVLDGVPIRTDRESTAMLAGAITYCNLEASAVVNWKTADGTFVQLGEDGLRAIALEVGRHVQRCFAREAELAEQIATAEDAPALAAAAAEIETFSLT
jgi:hypothetical protein